MLIPTIIRSLKDITLPGILPVFIFSIIFAIILLTALIGATSWLLLDTVLFSNSVMEWVVDIFGVFLSFIIAGALFPAFMPFIISLYDEKIARIVEENHYPGRQPTEQPLLPQLTHDAGFIIKALLLNILCLPLYFVPVINLFIYYALNGYLLGKEFFMMAALRYLSVPQASALWRKHDRLIFIAGAIIAFASTIPFLNLIVPFCGIALMTHLFHRLEGYKGQEILLPEQEL